jgi:hypothetical protein
MVVITYNNNYNDVNIEDQTEIFSSKIGNENGFFLATLSCFLMQIMENIFG